MSSRNRRVLINEVGLEMWRVYNTRLIEETSAGDRLVTHYEAILTQPRAELERILAFLGIHATSGVLEAAVGAVSVRLRHQRADAAPLDPQIAGLYAQLSREATYAE